MDDLRDLGGRLEDMDPAAVAARLRMWMEVVAAEAGDIKAPLGAQAWTRWGAPALERFHRAAGELKSTDAATHAIRAWLILWMCQQPAIVEELSAAAAGAFSELALWLGE